MSTYLNMNNPRTSHNDFSDCPELLKEYLYYLETIRGLSARTINGYAIDLRTFFRFLKLTRGLVPSESDPETIKIDDISLEQVKSVTKADIFEFLHYTMQERSNNAATRSRKISSLKGFFGYCTDKMNYIALDPTKEISVPAHKKSLPRYLSLDEAKELLESVPSDFPERDYCILTLFLNCGMRLSELVGINLSDFKDDTIRILGKGSKERLVYLNDACKMALRQYSAVRASLPNIRDREALFLSRRTGKRLTPRRVQQIVENSLKLAGLDNKGYSTHKLRHTAATLMYQYGNVDMLALKEILGHEHVSTTEIYTHISEQKLKDAVKASPLSEIAPGEASRESAPARKKAVSEQAPEKASDTEKD